MAIATAVVRARFCQPTGLLLFNRTEATRAAHQAEGFAVTDKYQEIYEACEMVLLGIKPQHFEEVLAALADCHVTDRPLILSIAAGIPFARIENALGKDTAIIRAMPNAPLKIGYGATQLVKNAAATQEQLEAVERLFRAMGITTVFPDERMLNDAIPYAGSAPAFIYLFADAMVRSAIAHGIPAQDATQMICQSLIGSAQMMLQSKVPLSDMIEAVCSPGGTTLAGVQVLADRGLYQIIAEMCDASIRRAYELADS